MMLLCKPVDVTDTVLVASSMTEADWPQWVSTTTYSRGQRVILVSTHRIYESAIPNNLGNNPSSSSSAVWIEVEATARWKPFDDRIYLRAGTTSVTTWRLRAPYRCNMVGLLNVVAGTARVTVYNDAATPAIVYDQTRAMTTAAPAGGTGWTNRYNVVEFFNDVAFLDLPIQPNYEVRIEVAGSTINALGEIIMGAAVEIGDALLGTSVGFTDYSVKERDYYGNLKRVRRPAGARAEYQVACDTAEVERNLRLLQSVRNVPALYLTRQPELYATMVYGLVRDPMLPHSAGGRSFFAVEVEGMT